MSSRSDSPAWLKAALAKRPNIDFKTTLDPEIKVGDIRMAVGDFDNRIRPVLVLTSADTKAYVCLLSNEIDMASDHDVLLPREETDLPFHLIAETDLCGPVFVSQIMELWGSVESDITNYLFMMSQRDWVKPIGLARGTPIHGPTDARWQWKTEELEVLQVLARECASDLLGDDDG
jgi:hypothetical protein